MCPRRGLIFLRQAAEGGGKRGVSLSRLRERVASRSDSEGEPGEGADPDR
jgi:hypothetical protein